jgi:hypothetical protein
MRLCVGAVGRSLLAGLAVAALASTASAQQPAAEQKGPRVGDMAPDFALTGISRYGILRDQVKLSDYRGKTVVIAFFFKARTRG